MGSYYRHTRTESIGLPYSFRCEQCGQESGLRRATIVGESELNNYRKQLKDAEEDKLREKARANLAQKLQKLHQTVTEKQIIPTDFSDECPHCHQPQSWALTGMKKQMYEAPITYFAVGVFFAALGLLAHYFMDLEYVTIPVAIGIVAVGAVVGLISLLRNVTKIRSKQQKTSSAMQGNWPVIEWESVQDLLNAK